MRLTKAFEQGVCIMSLLSVQDEGVVVSTTTLNKEIKGSSTYIQKIIRKLVVAKLVNSIPGNTGGFILARKPKDINLLEIVEALEGKVDTYPDSGLFREVFASKERVKKVDEVIHNVIREADEAWREAMRNKSVQDLLDEIF